MRREQTLSELQNRHWATHSLKFPALATAAALKESTATSSLHSPGNLAQQRCRRAAPTKHSGTGASCCAAPVRPSLAQHLLTRQHGLSPLLQSAEQPKSPLCLRAPVEDYRTSAPSTADKPATEVNRTVHSVKTLAHPFSMKQCPSCPFWHRLEAAEHSDALPNRIIRFREPSQAIAPRNLGAAC